MKTFSQILGLFLLVALKLQGGPHPNILFILTDDQRADSLSILGNPNVKTPEMDQLVRSGTFFSQAYTQGTMTPAACLPSRAMIMSGKTLFRAPLYLDTGKLLPEVFKDAGYTTFATGKWHNGIDSFLKCFDQGEAVFFGGAARDHYQVPLNYREGDQMIPYEVPGIFSTTLFTDAAVSFLKKQKESKAPFFCYIPFTSPHGPFVPPGKFAEMYDPEKMVLPPNHTSNLKGAETNGRRRIRDGSPQSYASYYGMISHLDSQIGRIIKALKATGKSEETIIVFASDHGLSMQCHGMSGKHNPYEHASRALLSISGPGIPRNQTSPALTYLLDIFPTLCQLSDLPIPEAVEGRSLAEIIQGRKTKVRDYLFTAYMSNERSIRDKRWKLFYDLNSKTARLFDLKNDPYELTDLSHDTSKFPIIENLRIELAKAQKILGDEPSSTRFEQRRRGFFRRR